MVNILKGTIGALCAYEKDEKSLLQAVKHFNDPSWRKTTLPIFENFQNEWIKMQKNL
jgi:hypothetical protein